VIWAQKGFTKYDAASLNIVQQVESNQQYNAIALLHKTEEYICSFKHKPCEVVRIRG